VEDIKVYKDLDHIRARPGMYIGDTGQGGLHQLVYELVSSSLNEVYAGFCTEIEVELLPDGACRVSDDGRGIPVDVVREDGKRAPASPRTAVAHGRWGPRPYQTMAGLSLHGVSLNAFNALSVRCLAEVQRDGRVWRLECARGRACGPVECVGESTQ